MRTETRILSVLAVEDDEVDIETIRRAFARRGLSSRLYVAKDGEQALEMLRAGDYALPRPCIVLLDQMLPRMNGIEFLEALRGDARLPFIDVYVMTASQSEQLESLALAMGVRAFFHKDRLGADLEPLFNLLQAEGHLSRAN